jgi:hypothetical protein
MACSCQNKRQAFEVITAAAANRPERVAFTSANQATAEAVAKRYPGSTIRDKKTGAVIWPPEAVTAAAADTATETVPQ